MPLCPSKKHDSPTKSSSNENIHPKSVNPSLAFIASTTSSKYANAWPVGLLPLRSNSTGLAKRKPWKKPRISWEVAWKGKPRKRNRGNPLSEAKDRAAAHVTSFCVNMKDVLFEGCLSPFGKYESKQIGSQLQLLIWHLGWLRWDIWERLKHLGNILDSANLGGENKKLTNSSLGTW